MMNNITYIRNYQYIQIVYMSQIVQIQIGQAGNRIGHQFWDQIIKQHNLNREGRKADKQLKEDGNLSSLFQQHQSGSFKARVISADMNSSSMQQMMISPSRDLFRLQDCVYSSISANSHNIWPIAYNTKKNHLLDDLLESIRRQVQVCDRFGGFSLIHSICGGTGSGLATLALQQLEQKYQKYMTTQFCLIPSPKISNIIVQPYNAVLALNAISSSLDKACILFDNQALFRNKNYHKQKGYSTFKRINQKIVNAMSDITAPFRFPCDGNVSYHKMTQNLVPFPRFKYLTMSMPFQHDHKCKINQTILHNVFDPINSSVSFQKQIKKKQKWLTNYFVFRGNNWSSFDTNYKLTRYFEKKTKKQYTHGPFKELYFRNYLPHNFLVATLPNNSRVSTNSVTSVQNSSGIKQIFEQISTKVCKMLRKKSYLHWYMNEGMELEDFNQAQMTLNDIVSQYSCINETIEEYNQHQDYYQQ